MSVISSALLALTTAAQPVITVSNQLQPYDQCQYASYQDSIALPTGPGFLLDLSQMPGTLMNESHYYWPPSQLWGGASFPTASIGRGDASQILRFYEHTSTETKYLGGWNYIFSSAYFISPPEVEMIYPCTYSTTWSNPTNYYIASGYGTLITPADSTYEVLAVAQYKEPVINISGQGDTCFSSQIEMTLYNPDLRCPVAILYKGHGYCTDGSEWWTNWHRILLSHSVGYEETAMNQEVTLMPMPAHERLTIDHGSIHLNAIEVFDAVGRVTHVRADRSQGRTVLDIAELKPGPYFLKMEGEDEFYRVLKFIVE